MGYTLRIINQGMKDEEIYDEKAPADGSPTDHTNQRWPSYTGWHDYATETKRLELWKRLTSPHPGRQRITKKMIKELESVDISKLQDYNKTRHEWVMYWVRKFDKPVIINS